MVVENVQSYSSGTNIDGGDITLLTSGGDISIGGFYSSSFSSPNTPGNAGDIIVEAAAGSVVTGEVEAVSNAFFIHNPSGTAVACGCARSGARSRRRTCGPTARRAAATDRAETVAISSSSRAPVA